MGLAAAAQAVRGGASFETGCRPGKEGAPVEVLAVSCTCTGDAADVARCRACAWVGVDVVTAGPCEGTR